MSLDTGNSIAQSDEMIICRLDETGGNGDWAKREPILAKPSGADAFDLERHIPMGILSVQFFWGNFGSNIFQYCLYGFYCGW